MSILQELKQRKIFNNITNEDKFNDIPPGSGIYIGFDPTSESLHLGNYIQISILKKFEAAGFKPIAILGGATGMIGDPSGKSAERNLLDVKQLNANKMSIKQQLEKFNIQVVDNYSFYENMNVLAFLRDVGKLLNVNYMVNKEVVKSRLDTGISFTEFSYQLIQGWDFKNLYEKNNVRIQVGGSDQWGNITSGIEIIRKTHGDKNNAVGITTELLTTSSGKKFGKSEGNALYLSKERTSPFAIYQYLLNTPDDDVKKLLLWLTSLSIDKIDDILKEHGEKPWLRFAQKTLAFEVVKDIHDLKSAEESLQTTKVLFEGGDVKALTSKQVLSLSDSIPSITSEGGNILDIMIKAKAASSKREAREFLNSGAIEVNGEKVTDETFEVLPDAFEKKATIIKRGKKKFFLIKH